MSRTVSVFLPLACFALWLGPSCMLFTTKQEGEQLRKGLEEMQRQSGRDLAAVEAVKRASRDLAELREMLPKARAVLLTSTARLAAAVDQVTLEVSRLRGRLETLEADQVASEKTLQPLRREVTQLGELVERIRSEVTRLAAEARRAPAEPQTAAELFARATILRLAGKHPEARKDYEALLHRFPSDARAELSFLHLARSYFDAFDFRGAIVVVARQLKAFPDGKHALAARLVSARSYVELKRCSDAMRILSHLVQQNPGAEEVPAAQALLGRLRRIQRMSRYCTP